MRCLRLLVLPTLLATGLTVPAPAFATSERASVVGPWEIYRDAEKGRCRMISIIGKVSVALEYEPGTDAARIFTSDDGWTAVPALSGLNDGTDIELDYDFGVATYPKGAARVHKVEGRILLHSVIDGKDFLRATHDARSMRISLNGTDLVKVDLAGWSAGIDATIACANALVRPTAPTARPPGS